MTNKVGFHLGIGGNAQGINGDYISPLDGAGVSAVIKSADNYGPVYELMQTRDASGVPHVGVFRWSAGGMDLPDYSKDPHSAAVEHWRRIKEKLAETPEFDKQTWLEVINEPDKNRMEWLAEFCYEIGMMMRQEGYKPALFGWSSGEPEPSQWLAPKASGLLAWVASQNGLAAIAVHEYDYGMDGMMTTWPYHIGRYTYILQACDTLGISRVPIIVSEWGWAYNDIPPTDQAMSDIETVGAIYAGEPSILGAALWYLGGGFGGIADKGQPLIKPVGEWCLTQEPSEPPPPIDPPIEPPPTGSWVTVVNEKFEGYNDPPGSDWYDQDLVQQVRVGTTLEWTSGENLQDPGGADYGLMEAIFRWEAFVPPEEWDPLLNDVGHAYKMFARQQPWKSWSKYPEQPAGQYRITLKYYDDNYVGHSPKVPPPDPLSFEARIGIGDESIGWVPSSFLQDNEIVAEFTTTDSSQPWFRFRGRWAILNVSAWVHQFKVEKWIGEPVEPPIEPPPVDPPDPPSTDCQDVAREPYRREYWVIPPEATKEQAYDIFALSFDDRITVGYSYDDAGVGTGLSYKKVVLYGVPEARHTELIDWYMSNYPGVNEIVFAEMPGQVNPPFKATDWPTDYKVITQEFGARPDYYGRWGLPGHEGLDIKAPDRTPIYAIAAGSVSDVHEVVDGHNYGKFVRVDHGDGYESTYAHLSSIEVSLGWRIKSGQRVGLADSTGNSTGSHLHLTLKKQGATESGETDYPYDIIDPTPALSHLIDEPEPPTPPVGDAKFGLHASATGDLAPGELDAFVVTDPRLVKILSSMGSNDINLLRSSLSNVSVWVVRAFLDWGNRHITPAQFYEWTVDDVERAVNALAGEQIYIEIHNEPNLTVEGLEQSWNNGSQFSTWFLEVLRLYKIKFPAAKFMYPGLSPGGTIPGFRMDSSEFINQSRPAINVSDAFGAHIYWSDNYPMSTALAVLDSMILLSGSSNVIITEASNNKAAPSQQKGGEYIQFWERLKERPRVSGVAYYIASALGGTFDDEVWVKNGASTGIPEIVSNRDER